MIKEFKITESVMVFKSLEGGSYEPIEPPLATGLSHIYVHQRNAGNKEWKNKRRMKHYMCKYMWLLHNPCIVSACSGILVFDP